ncbi:MAG: hypothetical protein HFG69_14700 [Hungatella sp.]|jgi:hypothetical protein|nr:hypothetical protein [Hungatella sp.]
MDKEALDLDGAMKYFNLSVYGDLLAREDKETIAMDAILLGKSRALEIRKEAGPCSARQLIQALGIAVREEHGRRGWDRDFVKFGEYLARTKEIRLNMEAIGVVGRTMGTELVREIVLSHELYHHFECTRWGFTSERFVRELKIFSCIPVKRKILPAAEIAAGEFTREFLSLDYRPGIIEECYFEEAGHL